MGPANTGRTQFGQPHRPGHAARGPLRRRHQPAMAGPTPRNTSLTALPEGIFDDLTSLQMVR